MAITVSKRLHTIASFVPEHSRVADIGSDHAYLPVYLVQSGKVSKAIAGELNEGPWKVAKQHVAQQRLSDRIDVRRGDGLSVLRSSEADVVCVAGMGGTLITQILEEGQDKLGGIKRLILQPNVGGKAVRRWLFDHDWHIIEEEMIEEDDHIYEILVAEKGDGSEPYRELTSDDCPLSIDLLLELGPILWKKKHPLLRKKWEEELDKLYHIREQIKQGRSDPASLEARRREMDLKIEELEEVIQCLPAVRP